MTKKQPAGESATAPPKAGSFGDAAGEIGAPVEHGLLDELRPVVTGRDGWFVAGKFDQFRRDLEFDGVHQAFRALGRLLLAEPEDEVAPIRVRMLLDVDDFRDDGDIAYTIITGDAAGGGGLDGI